MFEPEIDLPVRNAQRVGPNPFYNTTLDPISADFDPHSWGEPAGRTLTALLVSDAPAKEEFARFVPGPGLRPTRRPKLTVPQMPPEKGDACCWACLPDSIEPDCRLHAGYQIA